MISLLTLGLLVALAASPTRAQNQLETIRQDVRTPPPESDSCDSPPPKRHDHHKRKWYESEDTEDGGLTEFIATLVAYGITSPFWGPYEALNDDFDKDLFFQEFPYGESPGYMVDTLWPGVDRWAGQLTAEYGGDMDDLELMGGRLLVETTSRWGVDVQMQRFYERLSTGGHDQLWIGDANFVFRFAQSPQMQWRSGIGINWLDDAIGDDLGFNFTYGADWFPRRPWVVSATIDWGTLGHAELFRFRSTVGVMINRVEPYIGYEYLDIERTQMNSFLAGIQIWF